MLIELSSRLFVVKQVETFKKESIVDFFKQLYLGGGGTKFKAVSMFSHFHFQNEKLIHNIPHVPY